MKRWLLHIWMMGVLGMLAASCSQVIEDPVGDSECNQGTGKVQIMFTIAMDKESLQSRTTWGNTYTSDNGSGIDNIIESLQVLLFKNDDNGTFISEVEKKILRQLSEGVYEFVGELSINSDAIDANNKLDCKVMVLANGEVNPNNVENLASSTATGALITEAFTFNANPNRIPMWGIASYVYISDTDDTRLNMVEGIRNNIGTIHMLRAMAKVEVIMANNDYEIDDIALKNYNNSGWTLPNNWKTTGNTQALNRTDCFRPSRNYQEGPISFIDNVKDVTIEGNTYKCYTIYTTEYQNIATNSQTSVTPSYINVTINGTIYPIYFKNYTNGVTSETAEAYNIIRNHIYRYTIMDVNDGLKLTLSVKDWTDVYSTLNYQDDLSYIRGSWENNNTKKDNVITLKNSAAADATDVTAVYSFQINTPQTIEWMAVLEDTEGKFQFDMSQTSGKGTVEGTNAIQRTVKGELLITGSKLKLGVKAINPSESGQYEATLRVYVTYGGKTIELDLTDDGDESTLNHFTILHSKL